MLKIFQCEDFLLLRGSWWCDLDKWIKIKDICEQLLLTYDKEKDSDIIASYSTDWDLLFLRSELIVRLFNMTGFFDYKIVIEEDDFTSSLDEILTTLLNNCESWEYRVYGPDFVEDEDDSSCSFEDKLIEMIIGNKSFSEEEMSELRRVVERIPWEESYDEYFFLWMLENSEIPKLILSGDIDKECLEPLYYPVMLNPEAHPFLSRDFSLCCFIMGTSAYYSQQEISLCYMSYMLFIVIVYVEAAYRIKNNINDNYMILNGTIYY